MGKTELMPDFESMWMDEFSSAEEWLDHMDDQFAQYEIEQSLRADNEEIYRSKMQWLKEIDAPFCPSCETRMVPRIAKQGFNAGNYFWGCKSFPHCRGARSMSPDDRQKVAGRE